MREPLLLPLVGIAGGVVLGQGCGLGIGETAGPAAAFAAFAMVLARWRPEARWLWRVNVALCLVFAGAFSLAFHRPTRVPVLVEQASGAAEAERNEGELDQGLDQGKEPESRGGDFVTIATDEMIVAEGCVVEPSIFANDRARFLLELEPGARAQVTVPAYATDVQPPVLRYGQRVEVLARFRPPRNFNNPGAFDYAAYLARRDVFWTALVPSKGTVRALEGRCGSRFMGLVYGLRTWAYDRIEALYPNNDYAAAMLEAVLIGESANLERVWTEDFRRSGTYHALVISGIHVSVLAGVLLFLLRWLPVSRTTALVLTAMAAWTYALVSGFTAPVVRAAAGFTLYVLARMVFRRVRPLNLLAAIAIGYLMWDPLQLFEASFQLSFLSVAAIGAFAVPFIEKSVGPYSYASRQVNTIEMDPHMEPREAQWRVELRLVAETIALWTPVPLRAAAVTLASSARVVLFALELMVISASVQIGLALPMAEYFHRVSFTGLSANLLIVPLMNLVVPLGFVALFTRWPGAVWLSDVLLRWSGAVAAWHAAQEPAWRVPDPPAWLAVALTAMVL